MVKSSITIGAIVVVLACLFTFRPGPSTNKVNESIIFVCDEGKFTADFTARGSVTISFLNGRSIRLEDAHIANGARYSNADMSINLWEGGQNDSYLEENGKVTYNNCKDH